MKTKVKIENVSVKKTTHNHGLDEKQFFEVLNLYRKELYDLMLHYDSLSVTCKESNNDISYFYYNHFYLELSNLLNKFYDIRDSYFNNDNLF